jgi:uncharacterized membrane protein
MELWEIHPALVHFPIAFLVGAVVLDLYAWRTPPERDLERVVTGLYLAGVATGILAALAGVLAFYTAPMTFTEEAGAKIWWHIGTAASAVVVFAIISFVRWRWPNAPVPAWTRIAALAAVVSLSVAGYLGGDMVYHGAMGIEPSLVSNELREKAQK